MSVNFVQSNQVVEVLGQSFQWPSYPNGISKQIPCESIEIINSFWKIPVTLGNRVIGYDYLVAVDDQKPTPDSLKILRVKDTRDNTEYGFAIVDTDNIGTSSPPSEFAYLCDGLGGSLPVMPTVTIPVPIMQSSPQSTDTDGSNTFIFAFPANPNGLTYSIPYPWFNGVAPTTAYVPAGITTVAQFVTWATSNWSDYGTWSAASTNTAKLVSATDDNIFVTKAGMEVALIPVHYCITLNATPDPINGIKISGHVYDITPLSAGRTNRTAIINAIKPVMPGTVFTTSIANKIDAYTTQLPQTLTQNGSNVTGLTWTLGACS
jgi:hypothetical protein